METKKNPKADLERYRSVFFLIGVIIALSLIITAFEWTTPEITFEELDKNQYDPIDEDVVINTTQDKKKPPPKPKKIIAEILEIIDNEIEIEDELEITDMEIDEDTKIYQVELEAEKEDEEAFYIVEKMPEFPGGFEALTRFISSNIKYPTDARETGIVGKVFVRFVVTKSGLIDKVAIARGVYPSLDNEAIRVIKLLPKWRPGEQRTKPVNVWYTVPINFRLN
jgi:protein TonB